MDEEEDVYQHAGNIVEEVRESAKIPEKEKNIIYRLGTNIFRIGREMEAYEMSDLKEYLVQTLDVVYDLIKKGDKESIKKMREISHHSEKIFRYIDKIEILIEKISKNAETLEDNLERKVAVEEIITAMRAKDNSKQKLT